ncbi:MAG: hypothetical protein AVDCRST_MAG23-581, partial [uncultured Sphingosinicella sp.]
MPLAQLWLSLARERGREVLDLGDLVVFTKVVETERLTKAGQLLGS